MIGIVCIGWEMASTTNVTKDINILLIKFFLFFFFAFGERTKTELIKELNDAYQVTNENSWCAIVNGLQINFIADVSLDLV